MARIRHIIQDVTTAERAKSLGNIGEELAEQFLALNRFTNVRNLNNVNPNASYADVLAERDGQRYVISIKIRNKYERTGKLNARYKLGKSAQRLAKGAEQQHQATAAWVVISLEGESCSAYFGLLSQLKSNGVPMTSRALKNYECLARDVIHGLDYSVLENVYSLVSSTEAQ
jgi:hypothetical protein